MKSKLFIHQLTDGQRRRLNNCLRHKEAFTVRRAQILLHSADGLTPAQIAKEVRCTSVTVRNAIHAFTREGLDCLKEKSSRPHSARPFLDDRFADPLKDLLHHSPRLFGYPTSLWTLKLLAQVCHQKGWTPRQLTAEAVRQALKRLGIRWRRAKHWISSPDPAYARKKKPEIA